MGSPADTAAKVWLTLLVLALVAPILLGILFAVLIGIAVFVTS